MQITRLQLAQHYTTHRLLIREYFPHAQLRAVDDYVRALRAFDAMPSVDALNRLIAAQVQITASIPTIQLEP